MSLILMESCRQPAGLGTPWDAHYDVDSMEVHDGRDCWDLGNENSPRLGSNFAADEDDVITVGARYYILNDEDSSTNDHSFIFYEGGYGGTAHLTVQFIPNFAILVKRGDASGPDLVTTANNVWNDDTWFYIEVQVKIHDTTGYVIIRINGIEVANETGLDTRNGGSDGLIDAFGIGAGENNTCDPRICDIYVLNEQGAAFNDFLGPVEIESLRPNGAGNYTNYTPSAGDNHDAVDDPLPSNHDGDSTYVETSAAATRDSYAVEDLASTKDPIAVSARVVAKTESGTALDIATFLRRSSTDDDGPATTPFTGYQQNGYKIWEEDPVAAGAWTNANFDATEFGIVSS